SNAFKWHRLAADIGVTDAHYRLGVFYQEGRGVQKDYKMAVDLYQKATKKEHEGACYRLGQLYQYGKGVELNYSKAYRFYKTAADMSHLEAHKVLNITLEIKLQSNGDKEENCFDPFSQEYQDSFLMYRYVAEHGDTEVQFKVGFGYEHSVSEPNYVEAYNWYSLAAKSSHREAMYRLGLLYEKGLGIFQDYQKANQLYYQASQLENGDALCQLANAYHHGKGVKVDPIKSIEYYTLAAEFGNPKYQCELRRLYEKGELVHKNLLKALKWYTKAYLQGYNNTNDPCQNIVMEKDYSRAFKCLKKAADKNHTGAMIQLGIMYHCSYGVDQDNEKSEEYFDDAASKDINLTKRIAILYHTFEDMQDFTLALKWYKRLEKSLDGDLDYYERSEIYKLVQLGLGLLYEYGDGVEQDYKKAIECYKKDVSDNRRLSSFPFVYDQNDSNESDSQNDQVYCIMSNAEIIDESHYYIGLMYKNGQGVPQDKEKAQNYYRDAISKGCKRAKYEIEA
ncbi:HCP-like protein, partial [Backusella circina FSU 941]